MVGLLTPLGQGRNIIPLCWWAEMAQCLAPVGAQNIHCMNWIGFVLKKASDRCLQSLTSFTRASCPSHCLGGLTLRLDSTCCSRAHGHCPLLCGKKGQRAFVEQESWNPGFWNPMFSQCPITFFPVLFSAPFNSSPLKARLGNWLFCSLKHHGNRANKRMTLASY